MTADEILDEMEERNYDGLLNMGALTRKKNPDIERLISGYRELMAKSEMEIHEWDTDVTKGWNHSHNKLLNEVKFIINQALGVGG